MHHSPIKIGNTVNCRVKCPKIGKWRCKCITYLAVKTKSSIKIWLLNILAEFNQVDCITNKPAYFLINQDLTGKKQQVIRAWLFISRTQLTPAGKSNLPWGRIKELNVRQLQLSMTCRCRSPPKDLIGLFYIIFNYFS